MGDWSVANNGMYSVLNGLKIRSDHASNTGDYLGVSCLDEDWVTLNQMIKYYKFGFGKVTDFVNEEIRCGKITRKQGIDMIQKYDGRCSDEYINSYCEYLEITYEEFWLKVRSSVNKKLFTVTGSGEIIPKFTVGIDFEAY